MNTESKVAASGTTPLFTAAANGHEDVVRLLLKMWANPHVTNKEGQSLLSVVVENNHVAVSQILRDYMQGKMDGY